MLYPGGAQTGQHSWTELWIAWAAPGGPEHKEAFPLMDP